MPRTYADCPGATMTWSFCVAMMVGPFSRPSASITSGRDSHGSITAAGMLGISWRASDSARTVGPILVEPGAVLVGVVDGGVVDGVVEGVVLGVVVVSPGLPPAMLS